MSGKHTESLLYFKRAFELNPIPPGIYYTLRGDVYIGIDRYEEAIKNYQKAIDFQRDDFWAHLGLVVAHTKLGQMDEASSEVAEVYKIDPGFNLDDLNSPHIDQEVTKMRWLDALRKAGID